MARIRRPRVTAVGLSILLLAGGGPSASLAVEDTTAPVGSLTVGDGSGYAGALTVTVKAPATDDVGIASLRILVGGVVVDERAYTPSFQWTFAQAQSWLFGVEWRDAAGNATAAQVDITIDTTAPEMGWFHVGGPDDGDPATFPTEIGNAWDDGSPISHVRFRTNGGAWGAPIVAPPENPMVIQWPMLDPAAGGSPVTGPRTIGAQVRNAAGLWSTAESVAAIVGFEDIELKVSGDQRTGHVVTFTPQLPAGALYPANAVCNWSLLWGNDRSLYEGERDETFGSIEIGGTKANGYCEPWSVSVPWVPYPRFLVSFSAYSAGDTIVDTGLGGSPDEPAFRPGVDSTSRHISSSSLPLVYVLPEDYQLIVGEPATYRAYPVAGETIKSTDLWSVNYIDHPEFKYGGSTFTFTPKIAGDITVCWHGGASRSFLLAACYDPPARYRDSSAPNTSTPYVRFASGGSDAKVPVEISWSGSDKGWGIAYYRLERSVNGGAWTKITLPSAKTTVVTHALTYGTSYRYRVRAFDKAGNAGTWDYGATFKPRRTADTNTTLRYSSGWKTVSDPTAHGGVVHESRTGEKAVSFTFSGRAIAWIAERGPAFGKARVYVDGVYIKTVDTGSTTNAPRRFVFRKSWSSVGTHRIRIVVSGTTGRPTISLDGFAILR